MCLSQVTTKRNFSIVILIKISITIKIKEGFQMQEEKRPFHKDMARIIESIIGIDKVIIGEHCGGKYRLQLYYEVPKDNKRPYQLCRPDLLVKSMDVITGIIEIDIEVEKQDISPSSLFGNFLAANATKYYIPSSTDKLIYLDKSVVFVQILKSKQQEDKQKEIVKHYIRNIIPKLCGKITQYELFCGETSDFESSGRLWNDFNKAIKIMDHE